uniref:Radical SAM protein n=1 Tax=candidate division WOR-3 bacterium TaxID=2052148 RepID=A0A7C6AG24_UNCW3
MIKIIASRKSNKKRFTYGPVPSRRLGYSLGIDIVPFKTCTYNCIYCQLGRTTAQTKRRKRYIAREGVLAELRKILEPKTRIDFITFSGSGEPTLNTEIKNLIRDIKKITDIPVAVITNSSLLFRKDVQKSLLNADVILPTLTTVNYDTFKKIHRPFPSITVKKIIDGLIKFRRIYKGKIFLEIMLIKGFNDSTEEILALKNVIKKIKPDKIQLNTVVRPPGEEYAHPLTLKELNKIKKIMGRNCEVIAEFKKNDNISKREGINEMIIQYLKRRPGTQKDISKSLGINQNEIVKYFSELLKKRKIKKRIYRGVIFYERL